ncbi:4-phosphoerythronate dehydrogenase [Aestuariirhabdus sp. LZHN29]|uniref:4-phosphoerythronate dehydrogenase n=1 Tax=Aestuariirhabdus sp. LZHN29 TaxID=3417462 RepID=UPI003CF248EF
MKIIADENMPLVEDFFSGWGSIVRVPGREINAAHLHGADLLLVRSITQVGQTLLQDSSVRFVGSATIGTDHIDREWLSQRGIGFSAAPGCNALAVVQYVLSVLATLCDWRQCTLPELRVGIVGAGNVGGRLYRQLSALGVRCRISDPFLDDPDLPLCQLDELMQSSDVVSLHTPLTCDGPHPTRYLLGREQLELLPEGALLINSGRGPVVDQEALLATMNSRTDLRVALDVWETEPAVYMPLLERVDLATPHIAGYSLEGRLRGTEMVYHGACDLFNKPRQRSLQQLMPSPQLERLVLHGGELQAADADALARRLCRLLYDVRDDDQRMRNHLRRCGNVAEEFDRLRKQYPERRENSSLTLELSNPMAGCGEGLSSLGFRVLAGQN